MKNVVIIILSIIVLSLGGYLVFDKVINKDDNNVKSNNKIDENNTNEDINNEIVDYNLEDAKKLMEIYVDDVTSVYIFNGLDNSVKLKIAYKNLNYSTYPQKISYNEMNNVYKNIFGEEAIKQSFVPHYFPCDSYDFDETQNSYIYKHGDGCGGVKWVPNYSIKSAKIDGSNLDIVVYYYMIDPGTGTTLYLYHENKDVSIDNYKLAELSVNDSINNKLTEEAFQKYKDRLDTFTFRFEKYNGNYVLKDVFKN